MRKNKLIFPIIMLLAFSLFSGGFVLTQAIVANDNFETGDTFWYISDGDRFSTVYSDFDLSNADNTSQLFRYEERTNEEQDTTEGSLELFLVKDGSPNLPAFDYPEIGAFDYVLLIDGSVVNVDPSYRNGSEKIYDGFQDFGDPWMNNTWNEDTVGQQHDISDNKDDNIMPVVGNETYLIQFSEILDDTYYLDLWWFDLDMGNFTGDIPLDYRYVYSNETFDYDVNGQVRSIDVREVESTFSLDFAENFTTLIPFGNPDDSNTPYVEVNVTMTLTADIFFSHIFDNDTGMLLDMYESTDFTLVYEYSSEGFEDPNFNMGPPLGLDQETGSPLNLTLDAYFEVSAYFDNSATIDEANSFYGVSRPVSSGTNRIIEGDALVYYMDTDTEVSFDMDVNVDHGNWNRDQSEGNWYNNNFEGSMIFDVYRNGPDNFEAVLWMEGTSEYESGWYYDQVETGRPEIHDGETYTNPIDDFIDISYEKFFSSDDQEIMYFFEDNMWIPDFLGRSDENRKDNFFFEYSRMMPKDGAVNATSYHMDFNETDFVDINDFDHTWFDVNEFTQLYKTPIVGFVDIPVGDPNGNNMLRATISGEAVGKMSFYYDNATGVLLAIDQTMEVNIELLGAGTFQDDGGSYTVDVDMDLYYYDSFFLLLEEHPVEYQGVEASDPVDHTPVVSNSSSTDGNASSTVEEPGASLPVPIPIVPIVAAIIAIPILRKRK